MTPPTANTMMTMMTTNHAFVMNAGRKASNEASLVLGFINDIGSDDRNGNHGRTASLKNPNTKHGQYRVRLLSKAMFSLRFVFEIKQDCSSYHVENNQNPKNPVTDAPIVQCVADGGEFGFESVHKIGSSIFCSMHFWQVLAGFVPASHR